MKRWTSCGLPRCRTCRTLTTASRSRSTWPARKTSPNPPAPSRSRTTNCPRRRPERDIVPGYHRARSARHAAIGEVDALVQAGELDGPGDEAGAVGGTPAARPGAAAAVDASEERAHRPRQRIQV